MFGLDLDLVLSIAFIFVALLTLRWADTRSKIRPRKTFGFVCFGLMLGIVLVKTLLWLL